ncbi:MAG: hypothetical protein JXA30_23050 [Deltaproteobacteria bacterium]|nr:hypothetical protein [Deltaproteobacteria bacterium]
MTGTDSPSTLTRIAFYIALVAVIATHLGLVTFFSYPAISFSDEPINIGDFDGHIGQNWHFIEAFEGWGKSWLYDPKLLAGCPMLIYEDANNKAWELLTWALWKLGLSKGAAHNTYLLLAHLLVLPAVFFSARLFGLRKWSALVAMAMGSALWFFDSFAHWLWFVGMVSYAMACSLTLLSLAFFYRYLQDRRFWQVACAAVMVGVSHLVHVWSFVVLVLPMAVLYFRYFRLLSLKEHAAIATIPLVTLAINSYWLIVALDFLRYILDSGYYCKASLAFIFGDFFGLVLNTSVTGPIGNRTSFRFLFLGAAVLMLFIWRRSGDKRFLVFATAIGYLLAIAYFGAYLKVLTQVQPYRNALAAAFMTLIPAAALVEAAWHNRARFRPPRVLYAAVAVLFIPGIQHLSSDILYFFPEQLPKVATPEEGFPVDISSSGYFIHYSYRHSLDNPFDHGLSDWVKREDDGIGRFLVQFGVPGERLTWTTDAEIIGGFPFRNFAHTYSNIFRPRDDIDLTNPQILQEYFETFAIKWVVIDYPDRRFIHALAVLDFYQNIGPHFVYRTKIKPNLFQAGAGEIRASTNRIEVRGTDPKQDIVLRYNWLHTLVCQPRCSVKSAPHKFSPIGFIKIPAPHPPDFVILNGY